MLWCLRFEAHHRNGLITGVVLGGAWIALKLQYLIFIEKNGLLQAWNVEKSNCALHHRHTMIKGGSPLWRSGIAFTRKRIFFFLYFQCTLLSSKYEESKHLVSCVLASSKSFVIKKRRLIPLSLISAGFWKFLDNIAICFWNDIFSIRSF